MTRRCRRLAALGAAGVALAAPAPALGADVLEVDGSRVQRVSDPFVPERADSDLPAPSRAGRARAAGQPARASSTARGARALRRAITRARRAGRISGSSARRYARIASGARSALRRLRGARKRQLAYVLDVAEGLAVRGRLTSTRMPSVFLIVGRNTSFWLSRGFPRSGARVRFRGSEILFQYYPGRGLQLQPLANFKQANLMHGACYRASPACRRDRLAKLLDELNRTAARRSPRFVAWEYLFSFGGGSPPWISGMAQATAIQALGRAAQLLGRPDLLTVARKALPAFSAGAPGGVKARGFGGGRHYLQYSFDRRLFIMNAFLQSLIGLLDYARLTGDERARGLFEAAEPEARRELPHFDIGDWSRYSYRGRESDRGYHELLREFAASMCSRVRRPVYCSTARRFRAYQTEPAQLRLEGPARAVRNRLTRIRFFVSKRSAVQAIVTRDGAVGLDRTLTFRRGSGSFAWRPRSTGTYVIRLAAKELRTGRGLRTRVQSPAVVSPG